MLKVGNNTMLLNSLGRFTPSKQCRVFSETPKTFYKLNNVNIEYKRQHKKAVSAGLTDAKHGISEIEATLEFINNQIINSQVYKNLFKATAIPFCLSVPNNGLDFGTELENHWLPLLKTEFEKQNSGAYFRASMQGNTPLSKNVKPVKDSGYTNLLEQISYSTIVGYYFPTAFQEFDISSQRERIRALPKLGDVALCLSGPFEIIYSLVCYPNLLFDKQNYSPILCASSLEHNDPRMIMLFKSYGPHLEFWLMSQMLSLDKAQVSEQWAGGITLYKCL
jgi:hypothetical protein